MFCLSTKASPKRCRSNTISRRTVLLPKIPAQHPAMSSPAESTSVAARTWRQQRKTSSCFSLRLPPLQTLHHSMLGTQDLPTSEFALKEKSWQVTYNWVIQHPQQQWRTVDPDWAALLNPFLAAYETQGISLQLGTWWREQEPTYSPQQARTITSQLSENRNWRRKGRLRQ